MKEETRDSHFDHPGQSRECDRALQVDRKRSSTDRKLREGEVRDFALPKVFID
jgi:hypothetical protein